MSAPPRWLVALMWAVATWALIVPWKAAENRAFTGGAAVGFAVLATLHWWDGDDDVEGDDDAPVS